MPKIINITEFLEKSQDLPIVDVRAPVEFAQGHIPEALNIPLFNDEEREEVGTLYRQKGQQIAIDRGLEIAGIKIPNYIKEIRKIAIDNKVLVHCWRGGMRSSSMAWLLETAGLEPFVLEGGYKSFRSHIRSSFEEKRKLIVLSGMTGSGKTEVLLELEKLGQQVIDLEGLANHKGSAFGSLGQKDQPTTEQFENNTWLVWKTFDAEKPIWIEDESRRIGCVVNNEPLYDQMRATVVIKMDIPRDERVKRLTKEYAYFDSAVLIETVEKITKRLGGQNVQAIVKCIEEDNFYDAIDLSLNYYDKGYSYGIEKRDPATVYTLQLPTGNAAQNAEALLAFSKEIKI